MGFKEMVKSVQRYSGFSDKESKEALEHMVESLAVRLTDDERKDFASQLPEHLQDVALSVRATKENVERDIIQDFMETQHIPEDRAKKQIMSAWRTLKEAITRGEIEDIRSQLPKDMAGMLR